MHARSTSVVAEQRLCLSSSASSELPSSRHPRLARCGSLSLGRCSSDRSCLLGYSSSVGWQRHLPAVPSRCNQQQRTQRCDRPALPPALLALPIAPALLLPHLLPRRYCGVQLVTVTAALRDLARILQECTAEVVCFCFGSNVTSHDLTCTSEKFAF